MRQSHFVRGLFRISIMGSLLFSMELTAAALLMSALVVFPERCEGGDPAVVAAESQTEVLEVELSDTHGRVTRLADFRDSPIVVVAFLGTECPLVRLYAARLQKLADELKPMGVVVIGVNSNRQDSPSEIEAFATQFDIRFPLLRDPQNRLADTLKAERTPEVFVLGPKRDIVYHGRIDDQYGVGYSRKEATHEYLRDAISAALAGGVPESAHEPAEGCLIGRVRPVTGDKSVTYSSHIAEILNKHCVQCHRAGEIGPFQLTKFEEVVGWAETIREVVNEKRMPPWHADPAHGEFINERRMSEQDIRLIDQWVRAGAPAGDLATVPATPEKLSAAWHLGREPDSVISMGQKFDVPAEGIVDYQHIVVDPGFKEDKWVRAAEIVPGNRSVVHHVLVFVKTPHDTSKEVGAGGGAFFAGYVPGLQAAELPKGMAKMIPAGSKLVFQMHYTPNGRAQSDETSIGLYFTDENTVQKVVVTEQAINQKFEIPPHAADTEIESRSRATRSPVQLLAMMPHMHVRGKSFVYEAILPDGSKQRLLNVPNYDFNWQTSYRLRTPLTFPAGTRMHCVGHFDNSADNPNNPDPGETVRWGEQTWNEMMIGYFDIAVQRTPVTPAGSGTSPSRMQRLMTRLDENKDGRLAKSEVPEQYHTVFDQLDADKDGHVDSRELERLPDRGL